MLLAVAVGAVLLDVAAHSPGTGRGDDRPRGSVLVTAAIDGDTIEVEREGQRVRVRLKCVDAPEIAHRSRPGEPYGPEAATYTETLLASKWVRLESDPEDRWDRHGRLLAYVFLPDGTVFNLNLLREGWARVTRYPCRFQRDAREAEREAHAAGRGIWRDSARAAPAVPAGAIIGNRRSRVYHVPGQPTYENVIPRNRVYFDTEEAARRAGYRRALR